MPDNTYPTITYKGTVVYSSDTAATAAWMVEGLGFEQVGSYPDGDISLRAAVRSGDGRVEFYLHPAPGSDYQYLGSFHTDDLDATTARLTELGFTVKTPPHTTQWGTSDADLVSPENIALTLSSYTGPA